MQGTVVKVAVEEGQVVAAGDLVAVLEAMKMQHEMSARAGGIVARLAVKVGDQVAARQLLLELDAAGKEDKPSLKVPTVSVP